MNVSDFYKYLSNSNFLNSSTLLEIREVIKRYPYFQAARLLYLKNLHILKDDQFQSMLEENSIFFPDRKMLYNYINTNDFSTEVKTTNTPVLNENEIETTNNKQVIENNISEEITNELSANVAKVQDDKSNNLNDKKSIADEIIKKVEQIKSSKFLNEGVNRTTDDNLNAKKELINEISKREELLTFDQWLQNISKRESNSTNKTQATKNESDVINEFLSKADNLERIKPIQDANQLDLTENLIQPEELEFVSENLAQLYYKQGYYEKALKIYEKLFLKYPEKSIYFASLIQEIKQKIDKN
jgi:uncharacterized protein (DUF2164 family)